jgi:hypothetical protein
LDHKDRKEMQAHKDRKALREFRVYKAYKEFKESKVLSGQMELLQQLALVQLRQGLLVRLRR